MIPACLFVPMPWSLPVMPFLPVAVTDMDTMGSPALAHNMLYSAAHAMFYLVTGSHCILLLNEMEAAHTGCATQEVELKRHILELEKDVSGFD